VNVKGVFYARKSHHVARASVFLLIVALVAGMASCDGNPSQNLEIRTWYDLDAVRNNLAGYHTLMNDLNSTTPGYEELASPTANEGKGWDPIRGLAGTFDGNGYEIHALSIDRPDQSGVGFLNSIGREGEVRNIGIVNANVAGHDEVGGLTSRNFGIITNSYMVGNVTGADSYIGGLVGINDGTVIDSHFTGSVTGDVVGGLVGLHEHDTISNSYSECAVTGRCAGGIAGEISYGDVVNCYSTGNVTGTVRAGGLVGFLDEEGSVTNSYSTGCVTGEQCVGGLIAKGWIASNSYYNYDEVLINGTNMITVGALSSDDFDQWLSNGKFLDVNGRLSEEDGYYLINDVSDFKQLLAFGQNRTLKFRLTNDLDLAGEPGLYVPILAGEFDGNGHKISNLNLSLDLVTPLGLFAYLAPSGILRQVGVEDANVTGYAYVGGLVGMNDQGVVSNSYSTGSVTGQDCVGGAVGRKHKGIVQDSYSTCRVTGGKTVGGLVGSNNFGAVTSSYSVGNVTGEEAGGLVGAGPIYPLPPIKSFWDTETSGQTTSDGGTGKTTAEMQDITTFSNAAWDIVGVADSGTRDIAFIWNIVDGVTYPFLSWESV
jgi:hypothetical protein